MVGLFKSKGITETDVREALESVHDPVSGRDVVSAGLLQGITVTGGRVAVSIEVDPLRAEAMEPVRQACEAALRALPGVESASAVLTAESRSAPEPPAPEPAKPPPELAKPPPPPSPKPIPGVAAIVAVASGKGGVGKSTVAVNLALGLKTLGRKVGILDADIYGPSLPRMLALTDKPESPDGKVILPMEKYGLECMSIGFMVEEGTATIWRGPMATNALRQMLSGVLWGDLDVLVVDLPPGTGDVHLTMVQQVPITGAVIVSTPQDIALVDARKGMAMFAKVGVPVFGVIENMSYFTCPHCGERSEIFSHGGARRWAEEHGTPFLGEIPLHMAIRETSDAGEPIVVSRADSPEARALMAIASAVAGKIDLALGAETTAAAE